MCLKAPNDLGKKLFKVKRKIVLVGDFTFLGMGDEGGLWERSAIARLRRLREPASMEKYEGRASMAGLERRRAEVPEVGYGRRGRPRKNREGELLELLSLGLSREEISEKMGIKRSTLRFYLKELRKKHDFVRKNVRKNLLACPECHSENVHHDGETGETICKGCGLILRQAFSPLQRVPMNTTAAPTSYLGVGKSLGSEIGWGRRGLYQVLAKGPKGQEDLGLRARQIRIITNLQDPPRLEDLLIRGRNLASRLGYTDIMFNNTLGINLRYAFAVTCDLKIKFHKRDIVETALYQTLCHYGEHARAETLRKTKELNVNQKLLTILVKTKHFIKSLEKTEEPILPEVVEAMGTGKI